MKSSYFYLILLGFSVLSTDLIFAKNLFPKKRKIFPSEGLSLFGNADRNQDPIADWINKTDFTKESCHSASEMLFEAFTDDSIDPKVFIIKDGKSLKEMLDTFKDVDDHLLVHIDVIEYSGKLHTFVIEFKEDLFRVHNHYVLKYSLKECIKAKLSRELWTFPTHTPSLRNLAYSCFDSEPYIKDLFENYSSVFHDSVAMDEYFSDLVELLDEMQNNSDLDRKNELSERLFGVAMWIDAEDQPAHRFDKYTFDPKSNPNAFFALKFSLVTLKNKKRKKMRNKQ